MPDKRIISLDTQASYDGTMSVAVDKVGNDEALQMTLATVVSGASGGFDADTFWGGNLLYNTDIIYDADAAQPVWWDEEDGNVTLTKEDAAGEGVPEITENVFKIVNGGAGAGKYIKETLTIADEPLLDASVTVLSGGVFVYTASAGTVTLELYDDGGAASLGTATTTTTSAWTFLKVENITLGTTSISFRIDHSANSATVYFALPMLNVGTSVRPWIPRIVLNEIIQLENQQATATGGGGITSGAWRTMTINNTRYDHTLAGITLAANQITLPKGWWIAEVYCSGHFTARTAHRLQDVDTPATIASITTGYITTAHSMSGSSELNTVFSVDGSIKIELQVQVETTRAGDGQGVAVNFAVAESIYSTMKFRRLA